MSNDHGRVAGEQEDRELMDLANALGIQDPMNPEPDAMAALVLRPLLAGKRRADADVQRLAGISGDLRDQIASALEGKREAEERRAETVAMVSHLEAKVEESGGRWLNLWNEKESLRARLASANARVKELSGHVRRLLGDLSDAERAVQGWKVQGGMGENIAQENRGRFPSLAYQAHRRDAEAALSPESRETESRP